MALGGRKKTVEIEFLADTDKASREIKNVGDTAEKQGGKFTKMGTAAKVGFGLAAAGVGVAIDFLKDAAVAAAEDEAAQVDLALALKNTTGATKDQIAATEDFILKTSMATGIADDELRPALENLVRATGDVEEAQDLLGIAMDISTAKGIPLEAVTKAIGRASDGNVGALGRMGIKVKDSTGKVITFEEAMAEANRTMGGATEAAAQTGLGAINRFNVVVEEAKETLGAPLLGAFADALNALLTFKEELDTPGTQSFFDGVANFLKDFDSKVAGQGTEWFQRLDETLSILEPNVQRFADRLGETSTALDTARHAAAGAGGGMTDMAADADELEGQLDETAGAQGDLTAETQTYIDILKGQAEPVFAAVDAAAALADAQVTLQEKQADSETSSADLAEAQFDVAEALLNTQGKMDDLSPTQLNSAIDSIATALDKPKAEVIELLEQLGILDGMHVTTYVDIYERLNRLVSPRRHEHVGGVVPGDFPGQEVPVIARAGEPFGSAAGSNGHGGQPIVVNVQALDSQAAGRAVVEALQQWQRRNGAIPIRIRA